MGHAWDDSGRDDGESKTLASVGVGLRWSPWPWLRTEVYWGHRLSDVRNPHDALQDEGVQLRIIGTVF